MHVGRTGVRPGALIPRALMYNITMATVVQDEARWLTEWIEYHLLDVVGFEHFYIYDDSSSDNIEETLAPYISGGFATLQSISTLGQLPQTIETDKALCLRKRNAKYLKLDSSGRCIRTIQFGQQVAMVRHALRTYGAHSAGESGPV